MSFNINPVKRTKGHLSVLKSQEEIQAEQNTLKAYHESLKDRDEVKLSRESYKEVRKSYLDYLDRIYGQPAETQLDLFKHTEG